MRDQAVVAVQSDSFGRSIVEQPLFSSVTMEARLQGLEMITGPNSGGWFRGTPFRSPLQGGLKGLGARGGGRRSEGRRGLHLRKASRGLQGGLKGA